MPAPTRPQIATPTTAEPTEPEAFCHYEFLPPKICFN